MIEKYLFLINQTIQEKRRDRIKDSLVVEFSFLHSNLVEFSSIQPADEYFQGNIPRLPCSKDKTIVVVLTNDKLKLYSATKFNKLLDNQKFKIY